MRKLIKVCGMRDSANIKEVDSLGIDLMGFIFYPSSPRYVSVVPDSLPVHARRVGVFVDAGMEQILSANRLFSFSYVQLHGSESPQECSRLREHGLGVIKAFGISVLKDLDIVSSYEGSCDCFLFDTKTAAKGGSGQSFDWSLLDFYKGSTPFLLSGGIGPENVESLLEFQHPMLAGYDLNSRFETSPGIKDAALIKDFIDGIRK